MSISNFFVSFVSVVSMFLLSASVQAASQCKGLDVDACQSNASCGWVESYTRKDDRQVRAFCRTSSKGRSATKSKDVIDASVAKNTVKN